MGRGDSDVPRLKFPAQGAGSSALLIISNKTTLSS